MIDPMARKLPRYVTNERNASGTNRYYFRRRKEDARIRIEAEFDTPEFWQAYNAALEGTAAPARPKAGTNSVEWLIRRYRESSAYAGFAPATRRQRDNIFNQVIRQSGDRPYRAVTRKVILDSREKRAATPAQARNFLDAMRGLFGWALESELIDADPTAGVKNPPRRKGPGFAIWTGDEVAAYRDHWPLGTRDRAWLHGDGGLRAVQPSPDPRP